MPPKYTVDCLLRKLSSTWKSRSYTSKRVKAIFFTNVGIIKHSRVSNPPSLCKNQKMPCQHDVNIRHSLLLSNQSDDRQEWWRYWSQYSFWGFSSLTDWDMLPWSLKNVKCNSRENKNTSNTYTKTAIISIRCLIKLLGISSQWDN